MSRGSGPGDARKAKEQLAREIGKEPWCTGIGIAPGAKGGFVLRVNVDPSLASKAKLPREFGGFAVEIVKMGKYRPR
jgi:hypothetical protein